MAGVVEMLLQSHEDTITLLPALPAAWENGSFDGLVARGNFVVSVNWKNRKATHIKVTARSGGTCDITYPGLGAAKITDSSGTSVRGFSKGEEHVSFETTKGENYSLLVEDVARK